MKFITIAKTQENIKKHAQCVAHDDRFHQRKEIHHGTAASSISNLTKICGLSFEDVLRKIRRLRIKHVVRDEPHVSDEYFRNSEIYIAKEPFFYLAHERVVYRENSRYTYAHYEIGPDFDFEELDGKIRFHHGLLVERVHLVSVEDIARYQHMLSLRKKENK